MLTTFRKVLDMFDRRERWQLAGMLVAILVMAVLQTLGVASIMPFMALVANPELVSENRWLHRIYLRLGFQDSTQFLIFVGLGSLAAMVVSNGCAALTQWLIARVSWSKSHSLATRLLAKYLSQPYAFFLRNNSANLAKNILGEVSSVTKGILLPLMQLVGQLLVTLFILALLLVVDVTLALVVATVLGGAYGAIYMAVRRKQTLLGQIRIDAAAKRFKAASEAFGGIKDLKVLGREAHFLRRFQRPSLRFSNAMAQNTVVGTFPRYAMESVAFGGILLIVVYMLAVREELGSVLPVVGLYALAGYRLMPALQQIFKSLTSVRFNHQALDEIHADLLGDGQGLQSLLSTRGGRDDPPPMQFSQAVELRHVVFSYDGTDRPALSDISLTIPWHSSAALVGATGSGKTTLVDILLGLLPVQSGAICVDGVPITGTNLRSWQRILGYVPQQIFLCDDTVARNIAFGVPDDELDMGAVEHAARIANLHEFVLTLREQYSTVVGERGVRLSGGQRQRIGIARAVYHDPEVIVMDEATSALDGITEAAVMEAIQNVAHSKTVIMIAHRLSSVRSCDIIFLLDSGRIVARGTYEDLLANNMRFQAMVKGDYRAELAHS